RVVDLGRFDAAVVDEHTPESDVSGLRSVGIDVEIAPATAGDDRST
ncbi:MAG: hypothetical protein QOK49_141, partial [Baekduia sp.]|nr:hypothetical protein [Baekduia sp.]